MTLPTKIVVIGAGSASFGENTLSALLRSERLRGSHLALVDRNPQSLDIVRRLAERLNREWDCGFSLSVHADHREALPGAEFVVSAIEAGARENLWRQDWEITLKYGLRQPYAENGGPGGFAHAARNLGPVMDIVRDMEAACPEAFFINYTNPMTRICDAVNRHSRIRAIGLCHQVYMGYCAVGLVLGRDLGLDIPTGISSLNADMLLYPLQQQVIHETLPCIEIRAAGLNHFTWILSIHDRATGEDLYPLFRERYAAYDPAFESLTRRVFNAFGLFPVPGDSHLCEYLPWTSDPVTQPWEKYNLQLYDWDAFDALRDFSLNRLNDMADGRLEIDSLRDTDSEGALEMIENIAGGGGHHHQAAILPNVGQIANLPLGAAVETPAFVDGAGSHPILVGALPEGIAELLRREITVAQLCVDSVLEGNRQKALQCLLLDPVIRDLDVAQQVLDDYLETYKEYLPQFWR
jgi:alpha-galactosidase